MSAIFFGPALLSTATSYFSEGRVKLTRVKVSPSLRVDLAVVDFALPPTTGKKGLVGSSRAVSIDWKIREGFKLVGTIGPSSIKDRGSIAFTNFTMEPNSLFDWSEVNVQINFEQLLGFNFEIATGSLTGTIIKSFQDLKDVDLIFPKVFGGVANTSLEVDELSITMDHFTIGKPLSQQNSEINYSFKRIIVPEKIFEGSSVYGDIKLLKGEAIFELFASDVKLARNGVKAKFLSIASKRSLSAEAFDGTWELAISDIISKSPLANIKNYSGDFKVSSSAITHKGRAVISKLELKTDQYLLGQIDNGILDVDVAGHVLPSSIDVKGRALMTLNEVDGFDAGVSIVSLISNFEFLSCIFRKCSVNVDVLEANYYINSLGFSLTGNLKCEEVDCFNRPRFHRLQTDNTNEFFQALSKIGILNPIAVPVIYYAVSSGEIVGDGHVLNF